MWAARLVTIGAFCILTAAALVGQQVGADDSEAAQGAPAANPPITYHVVVEDGTVTSVVPRLGPESGPVISGLVMDPHQRGLEDVILMLGGVDGYSSPIPIAPDGSFVTPPLNAGTYVLQLVRTPHSFEHDETVVGFRIVDVGTSDVSGITVDVRRETAIRGRIRMESDDPAAERPTSIVVHAFLALDGMPPAPGISARGGPAGEFVLRDAFGPRVLRCGWTLASLAPSARWWPSRVILDGMDITNVPTDFSEHENGELVVVFTQHPARIEGIGTDGDGQPVEGAWVMAVPAERASWQQWATTSTAAQAGPTGRFSIPLLPGEYRVNAVPETTFPSYDAALKGLFRLPHPEVTIVTLEEWEVETVSLTLRER